MAVRVRFRMNKLTGDVEEFLVDDEDQTLPEADHDRIAADIARVLVRRPQLQEVLPGTQTPPEVHTEDTPSLQDDARRERQGGAG